MNGKVTRDSRTRRLKRATATKKMTVELVQGVRGQGPFVWPEVPEDLSPWGLREEGEEKYLKERRRQTEMRERGEVEKGDKESLREKARELLAGKVRWRSG